MPRKDDAAGPIAAVARSTPAVPGMRSILMAVSSARRHLAKVALSRLPRQWNDERTSERHSDAAN